MSTAFASIGGGAACLGGEVCGVAAFSCAACGWFCAAARIGDTTHTKKSTQPETLFGMGTSRFSKPITDLRNHSAVEHLVRNRRRNFVKELWSHLRSAIQIGDHHLSFRARRSFGPLLLP